MNSQQKFLLPAGYTTVFVAAALAFLVLIALDITGIHRTILKAIPVTTLLVLVVREIRGFPGICLAGALIGSVCGDIFLDLPREGMFLFGLVAFLIGHLFYTALFFRYANRPDEFEKAIIAGLAVFGITMVWLFYGIDPAIYPPVVFYIAVIVAMSIGALLVPSPGRILFIGAVLFIASDLVLAVNRFLADIPYGRVINISIYFLAQYILISASRMVWGKET